MRWATARRGAVLAGAVLVGLCLVAPAPASAARGVEVRIVDAPAELAAGDSPRPLVVEATRPGRSECLKVRWSLVLRLSGITLDQVQVVRVEEDGAFAVDLVADGDTARLTDIEFDPGTLCDDQTVTARYEVSVAGDVPAGELAVTAEAYDDDFTLLDGDSASRPVVADPQRVAPPVADPSVPPAGAAGPGGPARPGDQAGGGGGPSRRVSTAGTLPVPSIGFLVGGVLLLLGAVLLITLRRRLGGRRDAALPPVAYGGPAYRPAAYYGPRR